MADYCSIFVSRNRHRRQADFFTSGTFFICAYRNTIWIVIVFLMSFVWHSSYCANQFPSVIFMMLTIVIFLWFWFLFNFFLFFNFLLLHIGIGISICHIMNQSEYGT